MTSKRTPSEDPRINVQVAHNLRAKARNKAKGEGKSLGELVVMLLKAYVAPVKKAAYYAVADLHCPICPICPICLCGRTGDVLGALCQTSGCTGVIAEQPAFKTLVDELPEPMTCGRRSESGMDRDDSPFTGAFKSGKNLDRWQKFKSNGNRVCSYCGSLHPDDLFDLVRQSASAPRDAEYSSVVEIEPSDKSYKIYVHQPGVHNAHEGGIKFYTPHLPRNPDGSSAVTDEQNTEYSRAIHASRKRLDRMLAIGRERT